MTNNELPMTREQYEAVMKEYADNKADSIRRFESDLKCGKPPMELIGPLVARIADQYVEILGNAILAPIVKLERQEKLMAECHKKMEEFFATHTTDDLLNEIDTNALGFLESFNPEVWKDIVDNQVELDDESLYYSKSESVQKYKGCFEVFGTCRIDEYIPWQDADCDDFETRYFVIANGAKRMVVSVMYGQGSVMDTCTEEDFCRWMQRRNAPVDLSSVPVTTVDELASNIAKLIEKINDELQRGNNDKE